MVRTNIYNFSLGPLLVIFTALMVISCGTEDSVPKVDREQVYGVVQKGPYIQGAQVTMFELSTDFVQTGKSFVTNISDNRGTFEFKRISLESPFVLVSAIGYYFNENSGSLSSSTLQLNAILDIRDVNSINVNILTHLEKPRVEYLVGQGMEFSDAKRTAQQEIFNMLKFNGAEDNSSEKLDINSIGDGNAKLLAASVIIQGKMPIAELTQFLSELASDLEKDGVLSSAKLISTLKVNALGLRLPEIRYFLEGRYTALGDSPSIPAFEDHVFSFLGTFVSLPVKIAQTYSKSGSFENTGLTGFH